MTVFTYVVATCLATIGVAITAVVPIPLQGLWNVSASAPVGLYDLDPPHNLTIGDLVAVDLPKPLASFMIGRGYVGRGRPLLKRVMALPGQEVCRIGRSITVDRVPLGDALDRDGRGRPLPVWHGCRRLGDDDIFLMNFGVRGSLDGRYFGLISARAVIARATPVYTDEDGGGDFVWRAATR